jgi:hypothetical protein
MSHYYLSTVRWECPWTSAQVRSILLDTLKHNHWAILGAVVFQQLFSFVWYSPVLFQSVWREAAHQGSSGAGVATGPLLVSIISSGMFCYLLSWLFQVLVVDDVLRGAVVGTLVGLGFQLPCLATHYFSMGYGPELVWIDGLKEVILSGLTGVILAIYRASISPEAAQG